MRCVRVGLFAREGTLCLGNSSQDDAHRGRGGEGALLQGAFDSGDLSRPVFPPTFFERKK